MKITKQQFDELKNASDLEQVLKAVGIKVENEQWPQENDEYRFVDHQSDISAMYWNGDKIDQFRLSLGNIHRTEADAEHYKATTLRRWQAEIAIRRWRDEHCPFTPDWMNESQEKWYRYYSHLGQLWTANYVCHAQHPQIIYFATYADVRACAEALPDEWNALLTD